MYPDRYPATCLFHMGSPGFTVSDLPQPPEGTWPEVTRKGNKGKKNANAAQVAMSSKTCVPKGPPQVPAAQRRFFALRSSPTVLNHSFVMTATLPDIMAVLKEANCSLPISLTACVNRNGAVTLTPIPYAPSPAYSPFIHTMMKKLNQSFLVGENPFLVFTEAPTSVELLIHYLLLSILLSVPADLFPSLLKSISHSIEVYISGARFLQSDAAKRALKLTTSVVVAFHSTHLSQFGESIRLFPRAL